MLSLYMLISICRVLACLDWRHWIQSMDRIWNHIWKLIALIFWIYHRIDRKWRTTQMLLLKHLLHYSCGQPAHSACLLYENSNYTCMRVFKRHEYTINSTIQIQGRYLVLSWWFHAIMAWQVHFIHNILDTSCELDKYVYKCNVMLHYEPHDV